MKPAGLQRPLTETERLAKVRNLLAQAAAGLQAAEEAEDELGVRQRSAEACEKAFHALVVLADALLQREGVAEPSTHSDRILALQDVGRRDLANLYERAKDALHTDGYYGQQLTRRQGERLRELEKAVRRELEKLG